MELGIRGRLALVTGASSGLGRACALALAAEGARLAIGARRMELLEEVAAEARAAGSPDAQAYALDLADPASIDAMLAAMRDRQGDAEIVIANSGPPKARRGRKSDAGRLGRRLRADDAQHAADRLRRLAGDARARLGPHRQPLVVGAQDADPEPRALERVPAPVCSAR